MKFKEIKIAEYGVGIVTKQNATKDVPVGGEYMNVKKLGLDKKPKKKTKSKLKDNYNRDDLPQIKNKQLQNIKHTLETIKVKKLISVQEERIVENFKKQVDNIVAGEYNPIIIDSKNRIVNGHHRYTALQMLGIKEADVARLPYTLEQILEIFEAHHLKNPKNTFLTKADTAYDFIRVGKTISNLKNAPKDSNRDEPDVMVVPYGGKKEKDHLKKGLNRVGYKTQDADKDGDDAHVDEAVKKCKDGEYYCNTDQKCKPIPKGYHVMPDGELMKDGEPHESFREALGEIKKNSEIYVDMDGVLADFFGEWSKSQGVDNWKDIKDPAQAIGDIKDIDDFWLNLPLLPKAKELLGLIKQVKGSYSICTSPLADDPRSEPHKREWIKNNLSFFLPKNVFVTHNKAQFSTQKDGTPNILIDDYGVNIDSWEKAGGIGFKYKDYKFQRTAKAIKNKIEEPATENFANGKPKKKVNEVDVSLGKYLFHVAYASGLTGMLRDGHLGEPDEYFSMTADPKYVVSGNPEVQIVIDTARVSKMETFEKHVEDWESTPGAGDWAKGDDGDFESEYRVEETIPWNYVVAVKILKSKATPEIIELAKKHNVKLVGKDTSVTENFADGKKKGKSRPGRVKKSGASCKGSVTDLRKRAKGASGEKRKMYHWCANMKSGKK